jgi:hypothetical protein
MGWASGIQRCGLAVSPAAGTANMDQLINLGRIRVKQAIARSIFWS